MFFYKNNKYVLYIFHKICLKAVISSELLCRKKNFNPKL